MMRDGVIIIEDSPELLMRRYNTTSLEEAFLILSQKQETESHAQAEVHQELTNSHDFCP